MATSSVQRKTYTLEERKAGRSLIRRKKKTGPRTEP